MYKFEKLEVYQRSLDYVDLMYNLAKKLPRIEEDNLQDQLRRAATSIVLNIAEGSIGQTDAEQRRFLGMAMRSLVETVACKHLARRHKYALVEDLAISDESGQILFAKLQAMRRALTRKKP